MTRKKGKKLKPVRYLLGCNNKQHSWKKTYKFCTETTKVEAAADYVISYCQLFFLFVLLNYATNSQRE